MLEVTFGDKPRLLVARLYTVPDTVRPVLTVHLPADADPAREAQHNPAEWGVQTVYDEEPGWARVETTMPARAAGWTTLDCTLDGQSFSTVAEAGTLLSVRLRGDTHSDWTEPTPVPDVLSQPATAPQTTATTQTGAPTDANQTGDILINHSGQQAGSADNEPGTGEQADAIAG